jgi:hypothetical protein
MGEVSPPIIPVYLNQRIVFDVLAMLQDGFSHVTRVTSTVGANDSVARDVGATFGVSQALATLLKIDLSAKRTTSTGSTSERELSEERVHTPGSLLFKLRQLLREHNLISSASLLEGFRPGQIMEFTTTLSRNPILQLIDNMLAAIRMQAVFADEPVVSKVKGKHQMKAATSGSDKLEQRYRTLREDLLSGSTVDIVSGRLESGFAAVVTLDVEYLADPTMANLVEGQFTVLGKVIRSVAAGESINLLRKTAISLLPDALLVKAFGHLDQTWNIQPKWHVDGPAIHVLPIAIYA